MKTVIFLCLIALVIVCGSCRKSNDGIAANVPECIKKAIKDNSTSSWEIGSVDEYKFQGKLVYAFNPGDYVADAPSKIITSDCKELCMVGGFTGPQGSLCNGENFYQNAVRIRRVWEK